ncbi:MAG: GNAT family N-acetyltransferase [Acidimicrobiales bacterium]
MTCEPGAAEEPAHCPICGPPIELDDEVTLWAGHLGPADRTALEELYASLSRADLHRRFFAGGHPPPRFFDNWSSIATKGGFDVGAFVGDGHQVTLVGEAGYALLPSGDGELGMAVDPAHRGWLGPWLLDQLMRHAADRDVANIQALVLADNRAMLSLAKRRGYAVLDRPEWGTVRITMSTAGAVPSWPGSHPRPRVLVEAERSRPSIEELLRDAGFDVAICGGPCRTSGRCPVLTGEPCPLVDGADAVVVDLPPDDPRTAELVTAERLIHPGVRLIAANARTGDGDWRHRSAAEILDDLNDPTTDLGP